MADPVDPSGEEFETILAAVQETARGRWFLAEHARRLQTGHIAATEERIADLARRLDGLSMSDADLAAAGPLSAVMSDAERRLARLAQEAEAVGEPAQGGRDPFYLALRGAEETTQALARLLADSGGVAGVGEAFARHAVTLRRLRVMAEALGALKRWLDAQRREDSREPPVAERREAARAPDAPAAARGEPAPRPAPARPAPPDPLAVLDRLPVRDRLAMFA
jgi:hypothetical protein